jgi:hypothetical protein
MAKIIGKDLTSYHNELSNKVELQQKLIEELVKLNEGYEEEVKRLVGEYDKIYGLYTAISELLKHYDPAQFGYPKVVDKDFMKMIASRRNVPGVEFIDFSKPKADEQV